MAVHSESREMQAVSQDHADICEPLQSQYCDEYPQNPSSILRSLPPLELIQVLISQMPTRRLGRGGVLASFPGPSTYWVCSFFSQFFGHANVLLPFLPFLIP